MSVNEKLDVEEAGGYGSIAPEPENDAVAYVKRHTIALGALSTKRGTTLKVFFAWIVLQMKRARQSKRPATINVKSRKPC